MSLTNQELHKQKMGCLIKALMETAKLEVHDPLRSNHINESKDDKISMDSTKEASSVFLLSFGLLLMLLKYGLRLF